MIMAIRRRLSAVHASKAFNFAELKKDVGLDSIIFLPFLFSANNTRVHLKITLVTEDTK
jgi:hypothetical protein